MALLMGQNKRNLNFYLKLFAKGFVRFGQVMNNSRSGQGNGTASGGRASGSGVLRRLLDAKDQAHLRDGGAPSLTRPQPTTAGRAAATAIGRAADRLYAMPVKPVQMTPGATTLAEMGELLPDPALFFVVEGLGEAIGLVALCPAVVTSLIEVQTLGRVTARPLDNRRPTRSDAMICADFINALLDELGAELAGIDGFEGFVGYRYASFLSDRRALMLMLDDAAYRSLGVTLHLGAEQGREGDIFIALPQPRAAAALPAPEITAAPAAPDAADRQRGITSGDLGQIVQNAPIDVQGVLCRRKIRLGDLRRLSHGDMLPLPRVDLSEARLETAQGQLIATGKLGETEGYHAIRLRDASMTEDPAFAAAADAPVLDRIAARSVAARSAAGHQASIYEPPIADLDLPDGFRAAQDLAAQTGADGVQPAASRAGATL